MSTDIIAAIERYEADAKRGNLAEDREEATDHYLGRPYGDEVEGRSQVVMRDVADTIEWIKPSLLKIFCAGDEVVRFDPVGPNDEQPAQQETDFCNHVVMQKNNGFLVFHDWFHDALLHKNGYVVVRPVKKTKNNREVYRDLTDNEFTQLMQSEGIELVEHSEREDAIPTTRDAMQAQMPQPPMPMAPMGMAAGQAMGAPQPVTYHDCVVRQVKDYTCLQVINVPPERVLVHSAWSGLSFDGCPFLEVIDYKTISSLREEGYKLDDDINDLSGYNDDEWQEQARQQPNDGFLTERQDQDEPGPNRTVRVRYVWIRHDSDGDGISELHALVVVGKTVLEDEEDDLIPAACITPARLPHEHVGQSIDDMVQDLQRIRTILVRGFLDGMYLSMHGRNAIDVTRVNLDDMLVTRPGGIVRVQGDPNSAVLPMVQPSNGAPILQAVEYVDSVREARTGVTRYNQGMDADSLNKTAHGINSIMTASQQRIELIARLFAETGVKDLMLIVHAMSIKHGREAEMLKLRGQWVPIDPRGWKDRTDITVTVGIGTGNKDQMLQHLFMILQEQKQGLAAGLTDPSKIHNTLARITQNAGFKQAEEFWTDPKQSQPKPQQPPPEVQREQMKIQADGQKTQATLLADQQKTTAQMQQTMQLERAKMAFESTEREKDRQAELEKARIASATQIELARIGEESKRSMTQDDRQFGMQQAQQQEGKQAESKQKESAETAQIVAQLTQTMSGLAQAMSRPLKVVRGPDGRAAELH